MRSNFDVEVKIVSEPQIDFAAWCWLIEGITRTSDQYFK